MISSFFKELFRGGLYKPSQGKVCRRLTFLGIAIVFITGSWRIWADHLFGTVDNSMIAAVINTIVGCWFAYRLINFAPFADFLISVEAEMTKVSWPAKAELFTTTKVVLVFMGLFIAIIYFYDVTLSVVISFVDKVLSSII
ncbi:MAG: preprotein translocase subunit SecE [Planctomycetia bacterium]|nr:preprotein translocase subunit SecE [Planctomycetia bacterium]